MEVIEDYLVLREPSAVGDARRRASTLARRIGLDETAIGNVALLATEAAGNAVKHAGGGECLLRATAPSRCLELVVVDRGPGIANLGHALRDGFSSAGTPGTGLGAIARLSTRHDIYSRPGKGTALFASVGAAPAAGSETPRVGAVAVPYPGELVCGDAWAVRHESGRSLLLVADGLGHGLPAHEAARTAVATFSAAAPAAPVAHVEDVHLALRPTRGAAVAVAEVDRTRGVVRFSGIGNIAGTILSAGKTRSLVSLHGTAGRDAPRLQEFQAPWQAGDILVLHSDGIGSRWTLDAYPGLCERHPMLIAAVLFRDYRRDRDDATVVVMRDA